MTFLQGQTRGQRSQIEKIANTSSNSRFMISFYEKDTGEYDCMTWAAYGANTTHATNIYDYITKLPAAIIPRGFKVNCYDEA